MTILLFTCFYWSRTVMRTDFVIYQFVRNIIRSGLCNITLNAEIEYKRNIDLFYSVNSYKKRVMYHFNIDVILFVMCKENHTICNVYVNITQIMFGSCFTSCFLEGTCIIYVNCVCVCIVVSNMHCVVFFLCFISSCVPEVVSFSRLSFLDCPLVFSNAW
jgi:hypothetical protein